MGEIRISTAMVSSVYAYSFDVSDKVSVGRIARYLSQQEAYVETSTLELARPLEMTQRLHEIDWHPGDRLVILTQPEEAASLPAALKPGDKILKFILSDKEISSRGKKTLLVGKATTEQEVTPDIDLRNFIAAKYLNFISRRCLSLEFDESSKLWYAQKLGQTRMMIDEYELGSQKVPIDDNSTLRFFKPVDDPATGSRPIGEIKVIVEEVQSRDDLLYLESGNRPVYLLAGLERESVLLNVSENIQISQLVYGLATHIRVPLTLNFRPYLMRLAAPGANMPDLHMLNGMFLYTARTQQYAQNMLILRDIHNRSRSFTLTSGLDDDQKQVGRRPQAEEADPALDVDLYETITERFNDPEAFKNISRRQLSIFHIALENTWWAQVPERAAVSVFVNNARLASSTPMQLTSGDVLSLGPSVESYYARLEVEISARAE